MSERSIETSIEDVDVVVWFDYTPAQRQTLTDPAWDSEVTINAIETKGRVDIQNALFGADVEAMRLECFEAMEGDGYENEH